jgi:outer membrane receptor for ferrienterochelin and colicins
MVVRQDIEVDANTLVMLRQEFPEMTDDQASKLQRYSLYQNSDKGDVKGVLVNISANLFKGFNLSVNYAYTCARTKSGDEWITLERSIRHAATIAANYHHTWRHYGLHVNLNGKLQSKTYYTSYEDAPGFGVWNLNTVHTFQANKWLLLEPSIGMENIFNRIDRRIDSSNRKSALYSPGRMLVIGLKVKFN